MSSGQTGKDFENLARGIHCSFQIFEEQLVRNILWGFDGLGWISGNCENGKVSGGCPSVSQRGYVQAGMDNHMLYWVLLAHGPIEGEKIIGYIFILNLKVAFLNSTGEIFYNLDYIP